MGEGKTRAVAGAITFVLCSGVWLGQGERCEIKKDGYTYRHGECAALALARAVRVCGGDAAETGCKLRV